LEEAGAVGIEIVRPTSDGQMRKVAEAILRERILDLAKPNGEIIKTRYNLIKIKGEND
jgi:hypothetical protein